MITTKTATGEALLGLLTPPFDVQRLEISAAIADINVAANASAKTAGVKRDFRCCWSDSALQRKLTTRGSSANFCIQTADLSAFGRPGHWRKVAGCLPGRCGGVAAAFCCSPCWPATSRLGEDRAVLRTVLAKSILRDQSAVLWRFAVVQQPIPLASAGQGASAGCFDQLGLRPHRGAPQELR